MARTMFGVLAGVVLAWLVITLSQLLSAALYPPPSNLDLRDPAALAEFIAAAPVTAMACVLAGYGMAAFLGGWVAAKISRQHRPGAALAVGALVLAGAIANTLLIPHPLWMVVIGVLLPLPAAWLAGRAVRARGSVERIG